MVAYSFQKQFAEPIIAGTKQQTIRGARKRHARPGDEVQLFTGLRTRQTRLIGRATCQRVQAIRLTFKPASVTIWAALALDGRRVMFTDIGNCDEFAQRDGFRDWTSLAEFWREHHPGLDVFDGTLIFWGNTFKAASISPPINT